MESQMISDKVHILVVVRHPIGGIRTFLRYVYTRFDVSKYKFTIVLPVSSELEALQENLKDIDCTFVVLQGDANILSFISKIVSLLRNNEIDIVHSHGFTSLVLSTIPLSFIFKPHLFTSHDVFTEKQFTGMKGLVKRITLGTCFRFADKIHSVSNDAQENLLQYFPNLRKQSSKLVVIQNGIEIDQFWIDEKENWRTQLELDEKTFLIGFFGRFMAQKGFKYLIEAMGILSQMDLKKKPIVLAFGWGGYIREEQAVIKEKGLESFFRFMPFQENPAKAMRGLDVIAMPSLWEACPLQPMEALIAGVPVIATDCIGLREVLKNTPAMVVPPADGKALAAALAEEMAISNIKSILQFREKATERFDVSRQSKVIEHLISDLCGKS